MKSKFDAIYFFIHLHDFMVDELLMQGFFVIMMFEQISFASKLTFLFVGVT